MMTLLGLLAIAAGVVLLLRLAGVMTPAGGGLVAEAIRSQMAAGIPLRSVRDADGAQATFAVTDTPPPRRDSFDDEFADLADQMRRND